MTVLINDNGEGSGGGAGGGGGNTGGNAVRDHRGGSAGSPSAPTTQILPLTVQRIADALKGGVPSTADAGTMQEFYMTCLSVGSGLGITWPASRGITALAFANIIRASILNAFMRASAVNAIAASHGFLLPDDPIPVFDRINADRRIFDPISLPSSDESELLSASLELVKIARLFDAGLLAFNDHLPAAQLSSFEVSLDGISGQSGDPLVDILGYQPDADFIKRKQALDSLARLDFSKRKPYLLFTADVITGGRRQSGTIVSWIRMRDASGYLIARRDVFSSAEPVAASLSSADVQDMTRRLLATKEFNQVLSFYDWVDPADVVAFVDSSRQPGTLYSYAVSGLQNKAPVNSSFFDVPMSALYISPAQSNSIRSIISTSLTTGSDVDSVSPYPAISQVIFGDPGFGWILAGCNVLASRRRGDNDDESRSMSFIGSKYSAIISEASAGRMFIPNDMSQIHAAIDSGISSFGISQTVLSVLDGTGVTLFAAKKDDPLGFQPTQQSLESVSRGLARILSAIDPQSATLDPTVLAVTLSTAVDSAQQPRYSSTTVPATGGSAVPTAAALDLAFGSGVMDLTTYSGISRMMQVIRTIYDFYPGALV